MYQLIDDYNKYAFEIKAFCLMPNHFHVLIRFNTTELVDVVSKFFSRLQGAYWKYFSMKYDTKWPIFQSRFNAKAVTDEKYLWAIVNYIQRNSEKHFGIPHKERQRRSDVSIECDYEDMMKSLEDYELEL